MSTTKQTLVYTLTLKAPLLSGDIGGDPNAVSTHLRVRGSMILGALAARWLRMHSPTDPATDPDFRRLFLGGCTFLDALPAGGTDLKRPKRLLPIPRSLRVAKGEKQERIRDLAMDSEARNDPERQWTAPSAPPYVEREVIADRAGVAPTISGRGVRSRTNMHHVRSRRFGRPTDGDGAIFFYDYVPEGEVFVGAIEGSSEDLATLAPLLTDTRLSLGRSRAARYGASAVASVIALGGANGWREVTAFPEDGDYDPEASGNALTIVTVLADCLVRDPSTGELAAGAFTAALSERLDVALPEPVYATVDIVRIQGHVAAWNMGRGTTTAVAAGSVYVYETRELRVNPGTVMTLGDRTHEGYGRVVLNMQGGVSEAVVRRLEDFPAPSVPHNEQGAEHEREAWTWLSRRIADTWYAERIPLVAGLVRVDARPAPGALSALRVAVARGEFPGAPPDDPVKVLERCGLGKKNIESLRRGRVEGEPLLSRIAGILRDEDGAALRAMVARLETRDPEAKRPAGLAEWLSRETGRRFVNTLLERMRRQDPDTGRRGEG